MTFVVYDGENLLIDKITTFFYNSEQVKEEYKTDCYDTIAAFFERKSKLCGLDKPPKPTSWNSSINLYFIVGPEDRGYVHYMKECDGDLRGLLDIAKCWKVLNKKTIYFALEENGALCYLQFKKGKWEAREIKPTSLTGRRECFFFGAPRDGLNYLQIFTGLELTPLEAMVVAQNIYPDIGRRFDHYHVPTGKVVYDIDLSDRQREHILAKVDSRLGLKRGLVPIHIANMVKE